MADFTSGYAIAFPRQASYMPPASLPAGMQQKGYRVQQLNTINSVNGTAAATQIDVVIQETPATFIDPSTTSL